MTEKAYIVHFPQGIPAEASKRLQAWGGDNCWRSKLTGGLDGTSWIAIREKNRSKEQSVRHVQRVLREIGVQSSDWKLQLLRIQDAEARIEQDIRGTTANPSRDDARVVEVAGAARKGRAGVVGRTTALRISKESD